jgi:hypothetical protein
MSCSQRAVLVVPWSRVFGRIMRRGSADWSMYGGDIFHLSAWKLRYYMARALPLSATYFRIKWFLFLPKGNAGNPVCPIRCKYFTPADLRPRIRGNVQLIVLLIYCFARANQDKLIKQCAGRMMKMEHFCGGHKTSVKHTWHILRYRDALKTSK